MENRKSSLVKASEGNQLLQLHTDYLLYITRAISAPEHTESVDHYASIIDSASSLNDFIVYVRNKTRNGLFDEYQEITFQMYYILYIRMTSERPRQFTNEMEDKQTCKIEMRHLFA